MWLSGYSKLYGYPDVACNQGIAGYPGIVGYPAIWVYPLIWLSRYSWLFGYSQLSGYLGIDGYPGIAVWLSWYSRLSGPAFRPVKNEIFAYFCLAKEREDEVKGFTVQGNQGQMKTGNTRPADVCDCQHASAC